MTIEDGPADIQDHQSHFNFTPAKKIAILTPMSAFPVDKFSLNSRMAMKCNTKIKSGILCYNFIADILT